MQDPVATPYLLAMLLADQVIVDAQTQKKSLIGIFDNVILPAVPRDLQIAVYIKFNDAEGDYRFKLHYVHLDTDRRLAEIEGTVGGVTDRLKTYELAFPLVVSIDQPGGYEVRLYANDIWLGRMTFNVALREQSTGQA